MPATSDSVLQTDAPSCCIVILQALSCQSFRFIFFWGFGVLRFFVSLLSLSLTSWLHESVKTSEMLISIMLTTVAYFKFVFFKLLLLLNKGVVVPKAYWHLECFWTMLCYCLAVCCGNQLATGSYPGNVMLSVGG